MPGQEQQPLSDKEQEQIKNLQESRQGASESEEVAQSLRRSSGGVPDEDDDGGTDQTPCYPGERGDLAGVPSYVGTKIIKAKPMDECTFLETVRGEDVTNRETRLGYIVFYPDGYTSWSPKATFERAYRLLTPEEQAMAH